MRLSIVPFAICIAAACQGGSSPVQPDDLASLRVVEGVRYEADTRVMESFPVQLATSVTITNTTDARVTLRFHDSCVVTLRAYRNGQQVWDQRTLILCAQGVVDAVIEPGKSRVFETRTDAAQILSGSGLPDGEYQLEAVLEPSGETVRLSAGTVPLAIPR
jgi:hypothetical protein